MTEGEQKQRPMTTVSDDVKVPDAVMDQQTIKKSGARTVREAQEREALAQGKTLKRCSVAFGKMSGLDRQFMEAILKDRPQPVWVILTQGGARKTMMSTEAFVCSFSDMLRRKLEVAKAAISSCPSLEASSEPKRKKQKKNSKKKKKPSKKGKKANAKAIVKAESDVVQGPTIREISEPVDAISIPVVSADLQGELTSPSIDFWAALFRTAIANKDLITAENYSQLVQDADYLAGDLRSSQESELLAYLYNHFMKLSFAQKVSMVSNFRPQVINSRLFSELIKRVMDTHSIDDIFTEPGWKDVIEAWVRRNNNLIPVELTEVALSGQAMKNLPANIQDWIRITMDTQCEQQIPASMTSGFFGKGLNMGA